MGQPSHARAQASWGYLFLFAQVVPVGTAISCSVHEQGLSIFFVLNFRGGL
jgi:hypothetical protein